MILLAILTGCVAMMVVFKQTKWWELFVLAGWGLLAAGTSIGDPPHDLLVDLSREIDGWF